MLRELAHDVEELAGREIGLMPDSEVRDSYLALRREIDRLEALAGRLLATLHRRGVPAGDGAASTAAWVQWQTGQRAADANAALDTALACDSLPLTRKARAQGEISTSAARAIARGPRVGHEDVYAELEDVLVDFAARRDFRALDATIRHYQVRADALDDRDPADLNGAHISRVGSRWVLNADLDELAGQTVDRAIRAATDRLSDDDRRTSSKRHADALERVCRFFLDHGDTPVEGAERPHVSIVASGEGDDGSVPVLAATPLPQATIDRMLCDARVSRVVVRSDGVPLDAGRTRYTPNRAQRRAVMMRDGCCRFPGCDRRPAWCEVHHVRPWERGGSTDLANLACFCAYHHHLVHRPGWRVTFDGHRLTVTRPDGSCAGETVNQMSRAPTACCS